MNMDENGTPPTMEEASAAGQTAPPAQGGHVIATAVADAVLIPATTTAATAVPVSSVASETAVLPEIINAIPAVSAHDSAQVQTSTTAAVSTTTQTSSPTSPPAANITTVVAAQCVMADIEAPSSTTPGALQRAEFLSATLYKSSPEAKLGITIAPDVRGQIRITALSERGSVQHSPLGVGDKLLSINGKNCIDMDNGVAGELLRSLVGTITLIVHNEGGSPHMVETMVEKSTPSATVGIGVHQTSSGTLNISKVEASGLFAHSLVNVGDRVIAVNRVNCGQMGARNVIDMIRDAPKYVTLLTETQSSAGVVLAATSDRDLLAATWLNEDSRINQQHFCYCLWMIIVSLLLIGAIVLRPFT